MNVEVNEHHMWQGWLKMREFWSNYDETHGTDHARFYERPLIHQWHYIYTNKRGRISLVELGGDYETDPIFGGYNWEICGGGFTEDVERFRSKEDAEKRIRQLLLPSARWCYYNEMKQ